jgi:FkbH-like protein
MQIDTEKSAESIRLVIWDLDETFWNGTLSEGGITEYIDKHHDIVITLARRGIMSSICSKNDHATVKSILEAKGIWEYFIFPSINWSPKGPRLQKLMEAVQLRPASVIFIDDNHGNRAEAQAVLPDMQIADIDVLVGLLKDRRFLGKDDTALSRLGQYKLLEQRTTSQSAFDGDNLAFLRQSQIQVTIDFEIEKNIDRAIELINRTNQLNFTKRRLPERSAEGRKALQEQLSRFDVRAGLVSVQDRFGNYGTCGVFVLEGHWGDARLVHFAFSCRILGMGVEQWVYAKLGRPVLQVVGEVIAKLDCEPDWINVAFVESNEGRLSQGPKRVRLRGACELEVLTQYFGLDTAAVTAETVMWRDGMVLLRHHTALLAQSFHPETPAICAALSRLGVLGETKASFLDPCEDATLLIYSNIQDAHCPMYQHKSLPITLPIWLIGLGPPATWTAEVLTSYGKSQRLTAEQQQSLLALRDCLMAEFELVAPSLSVLRAMYRDLVARVPANSFMVWVLPREVTADEAGNLVAHEGQSVLNRYASEAAASAQNVIVLPYQEAFSLTDDELKITGHLQRSAYFRLFENVRGAYKTLVQKSSIFDEPVGLASSIR